MNQKLQDYRQEGVREYLVLCIEERRLHWFRFPSGREIRPDREGVSRSAIFPGLWIHEQALLDHDDPRLVEVVQLGLATSQHAAFLHKLKSRRRRA
jgi:hypothetical protein